jgi:hypothetical protein
VALETLETRGLMSVARVNLTYGTLAIAPPSSSSGNVAKVAIDPKNHDVQVSLNGHSEEFAPSLISDITNMGGRGGGDALTNNASPIPLDNGCGASNPRWMDQAFGTSR